MEYFQQRAFNWGFSEDDRIANPDQYLYWENIDTFSNPTFIQLSKKPQSVITTNNQIHQFLEIRDRVTNSSKILAFGTDEIYNTDSSTPVYSDSSLGLLDNPVFVLWDYVYWVRDTWSTWAFKLDRITQSAAFGSSWTPTLDYLTLSNNNYFEYTSHITIGNEAYISLGNIIEYLKADGTTVPYTNLVDKEIVGMADVFDGIYIFTEDGKMHKWDWLSEFVSFTITLNVKVGKIYQYWSKIYWLSGAMLSKQGLYEFDGRAFVPILTESFSSKVSERKGQFNLETGSIANDRENFYFIDDRTKICFYWNEISGTKKGFHYINTRNSSDNSVTAFTAIFYAKDSLYIAYNDWGNYWIDKVLISEKNTSWYLVTNVNDYNTAIIRKSTQAVYLRVYDVDSDHTITIQAATTGLWFQNLITVDSLPKDWIVRIPNRLFIDAGLPNEFEDITFKIILTSNDSLSPKVWRGYTHEYNLNPVI